MNVEEILTRIFTNVELEHIQTACNLQDEDKGSVLDFVRRVVLQESETITRREDWSSRSD